MKIVVALGGNALLKRGEPVTMENQQRNICIATDAIAGLVKLGHQIIVTHGNGPQVGLIALQTASGPASARTSPLDVLGAESEGMIGYMIELELANSFPGKSSFASLLTQTLVDADDPAFLNPTKPIGPFYEKNEMESLRSGHGWHFTQDGEQWRRVVPSPDPKEILEHHAISLLVSHGVHVICGGGGGIPVVRDESGKLRGVEAVIDKDLASALLALTLDADMLLLLTDVEAVYLDYGKPGARAVRKANPGALSTQGFAAGSMGPKVEAARRFASNAGRTAAIGALKDAAALIEGTLGTLISSRFDGIST